MIEYKLKGDDFGSLIKAINECTLGKDVLLIRDILFTRLDNEINFIIEFPYSQYLNFIVNRHYS